METPRRCFVISPIGPEGSEVRKHADDVFEYVIRPAMEACGITPYRSDHLDKPGRISDQMFEAIHSSDVCIAVLTGFNPNVFYELAIAQSAGRPVVILMEKGHQLPFDIKDLRCVYYDLEIRSYREQTHIGRIENHLREFEKAGWRADSPFGVPQRGRGENESGTEFFESSGEYGKESAWLELLEDATSAFDMMGITLTAWRRTKDFRRIVQRKAQSECHFRVLLMHQDNPVLPALPVGNEMSFDSVVHDIQQSAIFYEGIARECRNVTVRQMIRGIPHFFLTRSDRYAVLIQYLSSQTWGSGPLWRCAAGSKLYSVAQQEFDALWELNATEVMQSAPVADQSAG